MTHTHFFNLKISNSLRQLCRRACLYIGLEGKAEWSQDNPLYELMEHLHAGTILTVQQTTLLERTLLSYVESVKKKDDQACDLARSFARVLGDFNATPVVTPSLIDAAREEQILPTLERALQRLEEVKLNKKRDEIFHHIFGTGAAYSIWNLPRE
jgi:hypothetical protein